MSRPRLIPVVLALAAVLLAGSALGACGDKEKKSAAPADCTKIAGSTYTLVAENIRWNTDCLEVDKDQKVTFTVDLRDQDVKHNLHITGPAGSQKTPLENGPKKQTLTYTFSEPGTGQYVCDIHSTMEGRYYVDG